METAEREWTWSAHPARERPRATLLAVVAIAALSVASALTFGHWAAFAPAATILVLGLNRFLFPSRFRIDPEGIHGRYPLRQQSFRWTDVRRTAQDAYGIWLTRRSRPSRLDAYQGMHVLFGAHPEEVSTRIEACLKRDAGACAAS